MNNKRMGCSARYSGVGQQGNKCKLSMMGCRALSSGVGYNPNDTQPRPPGHRTRGCNTTKPALRQSNPIQSHTHTHALTHALTHARTHTHAHARTRTHTHAHARTNTHAHARTRTNTHAHARTHTHAHARGGGQTLIRLSAKRLFCASFTKYTLLLPPRPRRWTTS